MLVHTFNHLIPHADGAPTVLSSPSTSTYIPAIPYNDFVHPQHIQSGPPHVHSNRRDRRMRMAPYPLSIPATTAPFHSQQPYQKGHRVQQAVPVHSPRPIPFFDPAQAFDSVASNAYVHSPITFTPGAHGTILGPFATQSEPSGIPGVVFDELTATQMACMQATGISAHDIPSFVPAPSTSACGQINQAHVSGRSFSRIRVPRVPSIPQIPTVRPPTVRHIDLSASTRPSGAPHLPDAIPPEASQLHIKASGTLTPPSDTFPTPVELLGELSLRDAEAAQKDRRRAERRKAQIMHETETLGYVPTDPDTISTHDKKRLYLDCLEQYVIYLHNQLRLAGHEPVPVERVSSGRGLTSRSIRTMIVHLKTTTAKLHVQNREAELKYDELRAQLGADADLTAPSLAAPSLFTRSTNTCAPKSSLHLPIRTPTAGPTAESSASAVTNFGPNPNPNPNAGGTRRQSVAGSDYADPEPRRAPEPSAEISHSATVTTAGVGETVYSFP